MTTWNIKELSERPKLDSPILIEGLPGIGNVGKVAVDFLIDELNAKKLFEITSFAFPHSVFVNEDNVVELPKIEVYYKKFGKNKRDLLLLAGDVQPIDEQGSYEFCDRILDLIEEFKCKEIITLGGIGLSTVPKKPKVYCTGNSKKAILKYKDKLVSNKLHGIVGPIVGVSGLLLGLAKRRNILGVSFLAETYGHPMYLGVKGAKEILRVLDHKLNMKIELNRLEKEIEDVEKEIIQRTKGLQQVSKQSKLRKGKDSISYIG